MSGKPIAPMLLHIVPSNILPASFPPPVRVILMALNSSIHTRDNISNIEKVTYSSLANSTPTTATVMCPGWHNW